AGLGGGRGSGDDPRALRVHPFSRMSWTRNGPCDITSPDGARQTKVFGFPSPRPKARAASNSQVAPSGYRATPVRRSFATVPLNRAVAPEQTGKFSLAGSQPAGRPGAYGGPTE